jgi:GNAT superfamily N-acetyltransferase
MGAYRPFDEAPAAFDYPARDLPTAELKRMRVAPRHQRRGYGERILGTLEERAWEDGFERLVLDTGPEMDGAQAFYATHGFERVGRTAFPEHDILVLPFEKRLATG